ncbi:hypothetical protein K474DRAFT_1769423 [Panus rudis PR-1116 ss-1]|nr:hypothetical protein K474DRAFT_1769423 [Panus rudis PR-1116 ss-1]
MTGKTVQREDLQSYFERSATLVFQSFGRLEKQYFRPVAQSLLVSFQTKPATSTFLVIFALLSFLPVLAFLGFSLFVLGSLLFLAISSALVTSFAVIAISSAFFAITLSILFVVSLFLTAFILGGLTAIRLALLLRENGASNGMSAWVNEVRGRVYTSKPLQGTGAKPESATSPAVQKTGTNKVASDEEGDIDTKSTSSAGDTVVVIGGPEPQTKVEE